MRVEVGKWGNSAAVRLPAGALAEASLQIGQALELRVEGRRFVLEPAKENLDDLLAKITPQNQHVVAFEGAPRGNESW